MQDIRKFIGWIFAFSSLLYLLVFVRSSLTTIHGHNALLPLRSMVSVAFFLVVAVICGAAWRAIWKEQRSARGWGIAASVMHILIFFRPIMFPSRPLWGHVGALVIGITGLAVFLRPERYVVTGRNGAESDSPDG
jgi:hypothetical protein